MSITPPQPPFNLETQKEFEQNKQRVLKQVNALLKRSKRRLEERQQTVKECLAWQAVAHEGTLLQANLFRIQKGMTEITVSDWEHENAERTIQLNSHIPAHEQTEKLFRRSRKLRRGQIHAERLCLIAEQDLSLRTQQYHSLTNIATQEDLEGYCHLHGFTWLKPAEKSLVKKVVPPPKPYTTYISKSGLEIWVGKSAKDNDKLTFQHANGSDWWLHARDHPGSHVILRCMKGKDPDEDSLADAAELALRFSKNKEKGEVCLSQVKWLKRIKSAPGKVQLSKHKIVYVVPNEERWQRLKRKAEG